MSIRERCRAFRARLRADSQKGSAAIEFAMVGPIFFVLLLGTFESAIIFFSQAALQNAVTDMARMIRTGQVSGSMDKATFRTNICNKVAPLIACDSKLQIDVESFSSYGSVDIAPALDSSGVLDASLSKYSPGNACDVVLVRAFYSWPVVTPGLTWFLKNMDIPGTDAQGQTTHTDAHLVTATAAFRNEPYTTSTGGC